MVLRVSCAVAGLVAVASGGVAQTVSVHGTAYDSLHGKRLAGAVVAILGTPHRALSDSSGSFTFDSVAPGRYQLVMQHDALDAIGMSGASTSAVVTDGRDTVRLAIPSFTRFWRAACGSTAPADSGVLFGTVRSFGGRAQARAVVVASWIDVGFDKVTGVKQKSWHLEVTADSLGGYVLCGVPVSTGLQLIAGTDSTKVGPIDIAPLAGERIARRDLVLGAPASLGSTMRGVVTGTVMGDGGPVSNARVFADSAHQTQTAPSGRFVLRDLPVGTQQIEVRAIGLVPVTAVVDVTATDTANVDIHLGKVTVLDSVQVNAPAVARQGLVTAFLERKRTSGHAYFRDSTTLGKWNELSGMFADIPSAWWRDIPGGVGVQMRSGSAKSISSGGPTACFAVIWIDGVRVPGQRAGDPSSDPADVAAMLGRLRPQDIAAMEVYPKNVDTPVEFGGSQLGNGKKPPCGTVVIWTKRGWP
jgi:carboxypeptidase family protein